jgi:hypothetical protein
MPTVKPETALDIGIDGECSICAANKLAKNPPYNDTVKAAIAEGEAIFKGELPGGNAKTIEEALKLAEEKANDPNRKPISRFFGILSPNTFGDGVAYQRAIRDEWDD